MKSDKVYVEQMLDAVSKIEVFTSGMDKKAFLSDTKTQSATILQLTLIGELAKKITEETKNKVSLPWKDITGFRDRAIHDYYQIDLDIVWNTIMTDIATLKTELLKAI